MNYRVYGEKHKNTVILLHGGGLSWWNYREAAEQLQEHVRVILPILDGHADSDRPFSTIENNAEEIVSFIEEELDDTADLIGGLSLGAQVLLEMLSQRRGLCRCAIVESAALIPSKVMQAMLAPAVNSSFGLIKNRSFARLQFRSLHIQPGLFEDYYRDTCQISKENMLAFLRANAAYSLKDSITDCGAEIHIFAGGRETREVLQSAEQLHRRMPGSRLTILPGLNHGEFSLNQPQNYAKTVRNILGI